MTHLLKNQRQHFADKDPYSQSNSLPSSHVQMWELDHKKGWAQKIWYFQTTVLEKTLESPLNCMEIQPVQPKGDQSCVFTGRTDAEAETPVLWPPDAKDWLTGKDHDAGKDWRWEEKGTAEVEMAGWHHWLNGHEFEQAPVVGDGQGGLACCSPWGCKESETQLSDWTELKLPFLLYLFSRNAREQAGTLRGLVMWYTRLQAESFFILQLFCASSIYLFPSFAITRKS